MKYVEKVTGSCEVVWLNMKEAAGKYPLLIDSAVEVTCNVLGSATRTKYTEFLWLGHTGAKAYALLALASNNGNKKAEAVLLEGEHWGIRSIIQEANNLSGGVFPEAGLRDRRSIVIEICKQVHDLLQELDSKQTDEISNGEVKLTVSINKYDAFLDVEYIEEVMGFWEDLTRSETV
ncbi:hypothetical protein L1N85_19545 [Paenibacillus alkaliterrae]|uniref:hypothetical protein n=1 Tax=Paenibacillus alkaliterrae TaxID=320909 RepID=UPI001F35A45B|nr:hypothetical protein [Paenibacillus alkaliterrae]MCF2940591.1 hypothetical protein [Paenibacillus alkaliterrae]